MQTKEVIMNWLKETFIEIDTQSGWIVLVLAIVYVVAYMEGLM